MKTLEVIKVINNNGISSNFDFDEVGMTWGVSYIRFVIGNKSNFDTIEQFFISAFKTEKNLTSMWAGGKTWEERVDLIKWVEGLKISVIDSKTVKEFIDSSIEALDENKKDWNTNETIETKNIPLPAKLESCWLIKETVEVRHFINTTEFYLASSPEKFILIEGHWES